MVECPQCKTPNEKYEAGYTGEDGNDGVDHFFKCQKCHTKYETWYSRGSAGYTLSWSGGNRYIEPPVKPVLSTAKPRSDGLNPSYLTDTLRAQDQDFFSFWTGLAIFVATLFLLAIEPVNIHIVLGKLPLAGLCLVGLILGYGFKNDFLLGLSAIASVVLLILLLCSLTFPPIAVLLGWSLVALGLGFLGALFPRIRRVAFALLALFFVVCLGWRLSAFTPPTLLIYNGLGEVTLVQLPEGPELKLLPQEFKSVAVPSSGRLLTKLTNGTVVEAVPLPPPGERGPFTQSLFYNIKGRGRFLMDWRPGVQVQSKNVVAPLTILAGRGIQVLYPGFQQSKPRPWVQLHFDKRE